MSRPIEGDRLVTAVALDRTLRVLWVTGGGLVKETVKRHGLHGRAASVASELVLANVLLGAWIKGTERVQLQLQMEEPRAAFLGEIDAEGVFRGRFYPPRLPGDGLDVRGMMLAIKSDASREMYRGVTEVDGERVVDALQRHLALSEQVPARVRIELPDAGRSAFALVVEQLPGIDPDEEQVARIDAVLDAVSTATGPELLRDLHAGLLGDAVLDVLDERPLEYRCRCSRDRVQAMLRGLGWEELTSMREEDHGAEVTCDFCATVYRFDEAGLDAILASMPPQA